MQAVAETVVVLALFDLGGGEIILILVLVLILFGARKLPELSRGLRRGIFEFREAMKRAAEAIDGEASEAGRSVGGIYGKAAAQALTPDNQVAELYDPFQDQAPKRWNVMARVLMKSWRQIRRFVRVMLGMDGRMPPH